MIRFGVELEGRYIKPPKLRGQGKLALSTIQLIECLYVLRNAQDSVKFCTNGPICNSKARSADMRGEGAEQEPIMAYRTRDHQAKSDVCPSKVRHSIANDLDQEELMSLHGVLQRCGDIISAYTSPGCILYSIDMEGTTVGFWAVTHRHEPGVLDGRGRVSDLLT
jgi:hypothetical protein